MKGKFPTSLAHLVQRPLEEILYFDKSDSSCEPSHEDHADSEAVFPAVVPVPAPLDLEQEQKQLHAEIWSQPQGSAVVPINGTISAGTAFLSIALGHYVI